MYSFWPRFGKGLIVEYSTCFFIFNDSYFGPYSCLSFNAKQTLLFRSNCCCATNRSRHQFCRWISQLCILQREVPSLGYFWHLAVMVLIPASTSAILFAHTQLGTIEGELPFSYSFFFFMQTLSTAQRCSASALGPLHAAAAAWSWLFPFQLFPSSGVILLLGLFMAAASFAMFCFS